MMQGNARITQIMASMGCKEIRPKIFKHPDYEFNFDLSATDPDKILIKIGSIFAGKGFESCQRQMRELLGMG